jgi:hypothetical protein
MYFYSSTGGERGGNVVPFHRMNANKHYLTHFANMMFLKFVVEADPDRANRHQANIEIPMCEKKLTYWSRHPNFERDIVDRDVQRMKREWSQPRSKAA